MRWSIGIARRFRDSGWMLGPQRLKPRWVWALKRCDWKSHPSRSCRFSEINFNTGRQESLLYLHHKVKVPTLRSRKPDVRMGTRKPADGCFREEIHSPRTEKWGSLRSGSSQKGMSSSVIGAGSAAGGLDLVSCVTQVLSQLSAVKIFSFPALSNTFRLILSSK